MSIEVKLKSILRKLSILKFLRFLREFFCFFLDLLAERASFLQRKPVIDKKNIKNILAIRLDRIGDVVLTTPALRAIKEAYPDAHLAVLARKYTKPLLEGLSFVDEVIAFDYFSYDALLKYLHSRKFDVAIGFHPDFFVNTLAWRVGIPVRIGYRFCGSSIFLTSSLPDDRSIRIRHEVLSALEVVAMLEARTMDESLAVAIHPDAEKTAEKFFSRHNLDGKRVIVLHPGSRQEHIRWDKKRFAELADRLIKEKNVSVILLGSMDESSLVEEIAGFMEQEVVPVVGFRLDDMISIVKRCALFIGNSTGPMHIAAALGVPVVAIFGNIHPLDSFQEWGPWGNANIVVRHDTNCPSCHPGDCRAFVCMDKISVADVYEAACKLLDTKTN